jgi:hypothetical protein
MKKNHILLFLTIIIIVANYACKKDSNSSSTTTIEYQITPMNLYFTQIKYNDNTGNQITITDPSQFTNGTKSISISAKPFDAKLETTINNTTAATINYSLVILVNGVTNKIVSVSAPPNSITTNSAEYIVQ